MKNHSSREIQIRGEIMTLSLPVEDCLNRIIFNFYLPKASDKATRNEFLKSFVLKQSFGNKKQLYQGILKTERYQSIVTAELQTSKLKLQEETIVDFSYFENKVNTNLAEVIDIRNIIAHGHDITGAFLALEKEEIMFANKFKMTKISLASLREYSKLANDTLKLLEITDGKLQPV